MKWFRYILMSIIATVVVACGDDSEGFEYGDFNYDMVTYSGEENDNSIFTFQSYDDSPLIRLIASNIDETELKVGQRLLLNYVVEADLEHNTKLVSVKGMSKVNTDTIVVVKQATLDTLKRDAVKLRSVWRTGNYLNVRCQVKYSEEPRLMCLATTGNVDDNGMIEAYQIQDLLGAPTYYWLETYFSYYIAPVWEKTECKGLVYYVEDETYPDVKYYDFLKE